MQLMLLGFLTLAAGQAPDPPDEHLAANPLYKQLRDPGLAIGANLRAKLPAPTMADGLDAGGQKAVLQKVIGDDYTMEEFTRKSIVSPHILRIGDAKPADPKSPARTVDLWFIAYGRLDETQDDTAMERFTNTGKDGGKNSGRTLTADELAKRKIAFGPGDEKNQRYGTFGVDFLDKVQIQATGRVTWRMGAESLLAAAEIDDRFAGDAEFPTQWRPLAKESAGLKTGEASPYGGAGFYLKVTKLIEPAGALFVEQHVVFTEPAKWFDGANLLRSKFPLVVQNQVRAVRRELLKPAKK